MKAAVAALALTAALAGSAPVAAAAPGPLEEARRAAEQTPFSGVMEVRWVDGPETRSERLIVTATDSVLSVFGGNRVMAFDPFERLVSHGGGSWEELWVATMEPSARPDGVAKYQVTDVAGGPTVAGRPTTTVEIRQDGVVRERLYLDTATRLALRREQYDRQGAISRSLGFETFMVGAGDVPAHPVSFRKQSPRPVSAERVSSALAPDELADAYRRLGIYRSGDVVQVLYSDGVYDLSLFQQSGRLRQADLPAGERVAIGSSAGRRYAWAGGHLVVWSSRGTVFTAVSDAPLDQVLQAVRSMPPAPERASSLLGKLRRACKTLMEPLS
jgi:hypothetical protein